MFQPLILGAFLVSNLTVVNVQPECQVHILQPLKDDLGNHWQSGKTLSVTIERDNATGGAFCAHGGSCFPRRIDGRDAVKLLNCHIGPAIGGGDHRLVQNNGTFKK